jgi:hypothetical protein
VARRLLSRAIGQRRSSGGAGHEALLDHPDRTYGREPDWADRPAVAYRQTSEPYTEEGMVSPPDLGVEPVKPTVPVGKRDEALIPRA